MRKTRWRYLYGKTYMRAIIMNNFEVLIANALPLSKLLVLIDQYLTRACPVLQENPIYSRTGCRRTCGYC